MRKEFINTVLFAELQYYLDCDSQYRQSKTYRTLCIKNKPFDILDVKLRKKLILKIVNHIKRNEFVKNFDYKLENIYFYYSEYSEIDKLAIFEITLVLFDKEIARL